MPYTVVEQDGRYCVYKLGPNGQATGESLGCHDTANEAGAQIGAIERSEGKDVSDTTQKMFMLPTQAEVAYTTVSPNTDRMCANCRWYMAHGESECYLIENGPDAILPTGFCDRWEVAPAMPEPDMTVVEIETDGMGEYEDGYDDKAVRAEPVDLDALLAQPGVFTRLLDTIRNVKRSLPGFKALPGGLWVAWWSNNFKDREGEILSAAAHDRYVKRLDAGVVPMPELWFWHIPGTKHGSALWVDRIGHFMVAVGKFDDTEIGRKFAAHYAEADAYAVSHGFRARANDLRDGVWHDYNTFEVSPLPTAAAANPYTLMEVRSMSMNDEKRRLLEGIVGKEQADEIVRHSEERGKALEALGEQYKETADVEPDASAEAKAFDGLKEAMGPLLVDLTADLGDVVDAQTKALARANAAEAEIAALKAQVSELADMVATLKGQLELSPKRASQTPVTVVDGAEAAKELPANGKKDSFWE